MLVEHTFTAQQCRSVPVRIDHTRAHRPDPRPEPYTFLPASAGFAGRCNGVIGLHSSLSRVSCPPPQVSLQVTLAILAATNAIGTLCTIFVPDAKRMTLKDGALRAQSLFERLIGGQVLT